MVICLLHNCGVMQGAAAQSAEKAARSILKERERFAKDAIKVTSKRLTTSAG